MITRRAFIRTIGKGSAAVALIGVAACSTDEPASTTRSEPVTTTTAAPPTSDETPTTTARAADQTTTPSSDAEWARVNLGFVSAYMLVRAGEAALIDTGTTGSASQVESTLGGLGLGWNDLSNVLLTHHHGDHIGSLPDIMEAAPDAAPAQRTSRTSPAHDPSSPSPMGTPCSACR